MKIRLIQATWAEIEGKRHGPGDTIDVADSIGRNLINGGSAIEITEEVKGDVNTKSRSSGKD